MHVLVWLDAPLVAFGLLAVSPRLWSWLSGRRVRSVTTLLFYLGLGSLLASGVDVGLAALQEANRPPSAEQPFALGPINYEDVPHEEAPDFRLPALDEDRFIRLSDFRGHKPVVLIFGSFG